MRSRETSTAALAVMVVVAALGVWSCGGSYESPTAPALVQQTESPAAPVAAQATGDEVEGGVTSSCRKPRKITICHKGHTLQVSLAALFAHLRHGDRLGACTPPTVSCPCYTSAGLADVAAQCSAPPIASCGDPYSINLFCAPGGGGGTVGNLGLFEARLGTNTCSTTTQDPLSGSEVTTTLPVTAAQFEACRQAIVGSTYYPGSCPR
jgi:hypothetical protein